MKSGRQTRGQNIRYSAQQKKAGDLKELNGGKGISLPQQG